MNFSWDIPISFIRELSWGHDTDPTIAISLSWFASAVTVTTASPLPDVALKTNCVVVGAYWMTQSVLDVIVIVTDPLLVEFLY